MEISIANLDFSYLDKMLSHLSKEQVVDVIKAYYDGEKIKDILVRFEIETTASNLVKLFPPFLSGERCLKCGSAIAIPFQSKSHSIRYNDSQKHCYKCGHQEVPFCQCETCVKERMEMQRLEKERLEEIRERKRQLLCDYYNEDNWEMVLETDLSLEDIG